MPLDDRNSTGATVQIRDLLTTQNPLGPSRHEAIIRLLGGITPDALLYPTGAFDNIVGARRPIILGRKGAGKTAVAAAMVGLSGHGARPKKWSYSYTQSGASDGSGDIYLFINSWRQLDELVNKVGLDSLHSLGGIPDFESLMPETVAGHWMRRIWMAILEQIYRLSLDNSEVRTNLAYVVKYIQGKDIVPHHLELTDRVLNQKFEQAQQEVCNYLALRKRRCYVVIDALERYPVTAPRFQKVMAGFLKCVNDFSFDYPNIRITCLIPEEVESHFVAGASNYLKDLSTAASASRLTWKPIDLLRIVAERYRVFLGIHSHGDKEYIKLIDGLDFSKRGDLKLFYQSVTPEDLENRLRKPESAIAYIIRHTQLLPREFLMIFDAAILNSHRKNGSWRALVPSAIVDAISTLESELAHQILYPYDAVYPSLIAAAKKVLPRLSPICTGRDLDKVNAELVNLTKHETSNPWETLFEIGVMGYVDERAKGIANDRYAYGRFRFNSDALKPITFTSQRHFCVHPVFSGTWGLKRTPEDTRSVYPAEVGEVPWED